MMRKNVWSRAIIAHVDHCKTALAAGLLRPSGTYIAGLILGNPEAFVATSRASLRVLSLS